MGKHQPPTLPLAAHVVEEVVAMFDQARDLRSPQVVILVGSRFEARARTVLDLLVEAEVDSREPPIPQWRKP